MASIEALQERLQQLQLKASEKRKQFREGERWLVQIAEEKAVAEFQFKKAREDFIKHAETDCLELCTMMYKRLPKELRDAVYQYLCIDEGYIPIGPYYHFRKYEMEDSETHIDYIESGMDSSIADSDPEENSSIVDSEPEENSTIVMPDGRLKHDHSRHPPSDKILPSSHIFSEEYVGQEVASELRKVYYSENAFSICNLGWEPLLSHPCPYEECDDLSGFRPIDYMQNLQIRIKAEGLLDDSTEPHVSLFTGHMLELSFLKDIVSGLDELWHVIQDTRSKHQLQIELVLMTELLPPEMDREDDECQIDMINLLESMRDFVYKAMYDRENTTIRITHHDDSLWPFPKNYTNMFGLTREQWQHDKASHMNNVERGNGHWINPTQFRHETLFEKAENAVYADELDDFIRERWGIRSLSDTRCTLPITEGKYWPVRSLEPASPGHEEHTG